MVVVPLTDNDPAAAIARLQFLLGDASPQLTPYHLYSVAAGVNATAIEHNAFHRLPPVTIIPGPAFADGASAALGPFVALGLVAVGVVLGLRSLKVKVCVVLLCCCVVPRKMCGSLVTCDVM